MLTRISLAAASGLALALAFEPVAAWLLLPPAVAGFALATRGMRARGTWLIGWVFGAAFLFVHLWWMRAVGLDAWVALAGAESGFFAVLGATAPVLHRRPGWPCWLAAAWVVIEVWRSAWPFGGMPWGRLAFATADTPASTLLPYLGATGVSFVLALLGTGLAWLLVERRRAPVLLVGAIVAVVGLANLVPCTRFVAGDSHGHVRIAAVQGDVPGDGDDILYDYRGVTQNQVQATLDLASQVRAGLVAAPDFVVWPENSTAIDPFADTQTDAAISTAVRGIDRPVLVGAVVDDGPAYVLNQGIVWDPVTGAGDRYTKRHPVPYGEYLPLRGLLEGQFGRLAEVPRDMLSGTREEPLSIAGIPVADAICFDVAYDDTIPEQVARGAQVLVVQTSNATFIHTSQIDQQFAITRLRAMETGRWVVVAATNGITGIIAPDGRVVDALAPQTRGVLVDTVGLETAITPATRIGGGAGWLCAVLVVIGLLFDRLPYLRRSPRAMTSADEQQRART